MSARAQAEKKARERVARRLAELQAAHGGRFYWNNGVVRHVTLHATKGVRDYRHSTLRAPLIDGLTVVAGASA